MVILMDDENRENEGDLVIAAEYIPMSSILWHVKQSNLHANEWEALCNSFILMVDDNGFLQILQCR